MRRLSNLVVELLGVWLFMLALPVVINFATSDPHPWWSWPAFVLLGIVLTGFEIHRFRRNQLERTAAGVTLDGQLRADAIRLVRRRLDGRLQQSLGQHPEVTVGLHALMDVVAPNPDVVVLDPSDAPARLPDRPDVVDAFDVYRGSLLVAGEAGAGKTVMAMKLAVALLDRAQLDQQAAVPVLVDLGEWAEATKAGEDDLTWLCASIGRAYHIGGAITRRWIEERRLVLVLDGLDELWGDRRGGCVAWINRLQQRYAMPPTVVCCRTSALAGQRLALRGAVVLEPLTREQVNGYLGFAPEIADRPLWLRLIRDAYPTAGPVPAADQNAIIEAYVGAVLRGGPYPPAKMRAWLTRLVEPKMRSSAHVYQVPRRRPWAGLPRELAPELRYPYCVRLLPALLAGLVGALALALTLRYGVLTAVLATFAGMFWVIVVGEKSVEEVPAGPVRRGTGWLAGTTAGAVVGLAWWGLAEAVRAATGLHWTIAAVASFGTGAFGFLAAIPAIGVLHEQPRRRWRAGVWRMRATLAGAVLAGAAVAVASGSAMPGQIAFVPVVAAFLGSAAGFAAALNIANRATNLAVYGLGVWFLEAAYGTMPRRPHAFFAHAADCGLLIRDGDGYRFLHATVHDHLLRP